MNSVPPVGSFVKCVDTNGYAELQKGKIYKTLKDRCGQPDHLSIMTNYGPMCWSGLEKFSLVNINNLVVKKITI